MWVFYFLLRAVYHCFTFVLTHYLYLVTVFRFFACYSLLILFCGNFECFVRIYCIHSVVHRFFVLLIDFICFQSVAYRMFVLSLSDNIINCRFDVIDLK